MDNVLTSFEKLFENKTFITEENELSPTNDRFLVLVARAINIGLMDNDKAVIQTINF